MRTYRAPAHEVRVYERAADVEELNKALLVFVRNTSSAHRTQARQIQQKFDRPNNPHGTFYYAGFYEEDKVIGFAMFGYYPRRRILIFDHMTIDARHRKHRSFYIFAALLQDCVEELCPDYDFAVAEIGTDPVFTQDEINGVALVRLLRQVGFGRVQMKYSLANMEPRSYRHRIKAALMVRGAQRMTQIRAEELLDIYEVILFEHYPWFTDFVGNQVVAYEKHLKDLFSRT